MERDARYDIFPPEPGDENFTLTIAGDRFNIIDILRKREPITVYTDKIKPGDEEAQDLIRTFTNLSGVTP